MPGLKLNKYMEGRKEEKKGGRGRGKKIKGRKEEKNKIPNK